MLVDYWSYTDGDGQVELTRIFDERTRAIVSVDRHSGHLVREETVCFGDAVYTVSAAVLAQ